MAVVVYGCRGDPLPKWDSFCISPGHVSPPSPSQTHEPKPSLARRGALWFVV